MLVLRWLSVLTLPLLANGAEYQLCFLEDGPNAGKLPAEQAKQLQAEHTQHINRMWKDGALESAGPVAGLARTRGIFLFNSSAETAAKLGAADPKVAGDLKLRC
jgi:hypothetical protein